MNDPNLLLPKNQAEARQIQQALGNMVMQLRINRSAEIHEMLLVRALRLGEPRDGEQWRGEDIINAQQIAQEAVKHADAFIRALGFRVEKKG